MADDLMAFLRARLGEDESNQCHTFRVRDFEGEPCPACGKPASGFGAPLDNGAARITHGDGLWNGCDISAEQVNEFLHDGRTDEALRAQRDIDAKRRVLARHAIDPSKSNDPIWANACTGCGWYGPCDDPVPANLNECPELRDMATVYASHVDYREEWRPTS